MASIGAAPSDEVHAFVNDLECTVETHLFGRRMYEVMVAWGSDEMLADETPVIADFARIWRGADKVVYPATLEQPASTRTQIVRTFDPDEVRAMKASSSGALSIVDERRFANGTVYLAYRSVHPV